MLPNKTAKMHSSKSQKYQFQLCFLFVLRECKRMICKYGKMVRRQRERSGGTGQGTTATT